MNWPLAICRNRTALLAIVAAIVALIGDRNSGMIARAVRNAALALLRPAEAAARRLIVIAARGIVAPLYARRPFKPFAPGRGQSDAAPARIPAFRLFDPAGLHVVRRPTRKLTCVPRIRTFWGPDAAPPPTPPAVNLRPLAVVPATRLHLRIAALERALADLPRQARRLARRLRSLSEAARFRGGSPLRLGRPPGWRRRPGREVDLVLRECHALAGDALAQELAQDTC